MKCLWTDCSLCPVQKKIDLGSGEMGGFYHQNRIKTTLLGHCSHCENILLTSEMTVLLFCGIHKIGFEH